MKEKRERLLNIRLTEGERQTFKLLASVRRSNISRMLRTLVIEEAQRSGVLPTEEELRKEGVPC